MNKLFTLFAFLLIVSAKGQTLYYPPTSGNTWDTVSPASLGWCQDRIDTLYNYLEDRNTFGFVLLKDGKIALEKYYGTFGQDSTNKWASAGKSLTAMLTGIAQEKGFLSITDSVTKYLGAGWTSCTTAEENQITIRHLITQTSGLNENPSGLLCSNTSTAPRCLEYLAPPGTRWAYHTGAYRQVQDVIPAASGVNYNTFTSTYLGSHIGMGGSWSNYIYASTVRDAARFGLLTLGKGIWASDTLLHDTAYFNAMTNTSQNFNLSYGYLWWLNGKASFMAPGSQTVFPATLMSNAPPDMFAALGAEDQKIYVAPSLNMVVVRFGNAAYTSAAAFSPFDNELWGYINNLSCITTTENKTGRKEDRISIYPNPMQDIFTVDVSTEQSDFIISDITGRKVFEQKNITGKTEINCSDFPDGIYFIRISSGENIINKRIIVCH